jgi:hypothetical protein
MKSIRLFGEYYDDYELLETCLEGTQVLMRFSQEPSEA